MAHPIIARLEAIKAAFLKKAVQKQDVVDFYLLSLLPEEWLAKSEIGPEHINGRVLFDAIIMALREEYITRGMDELKDEAETTRWTNEIADGDIDEHLKPYFKYHESGYSGSGQYGDDEDDEDSEPDYDTSCNNCGNGLYSDDAYSFNDNTYCSDCHGEAVRDAVERNTTYCKTHDKFLVPDWIDDEGETPHDYDAEGNHPRGKEHDIVSGREGAKIHDELVQNREKQMKLPGIRPERPPMPDFSKNAVTPADVDITCAVCGMLGGQHPVTGECPSVPGGIFTRPADIGQTKDWKNPNAPETAPTEWTKLPGTQAKHSRWLQIKAHRRTLYAGGAYWEAPERFDGYSSTDFYNVFQYAPWKQSYGGPLWAEVARTINQMENTTDPKKVALLIDHFHDLGHNTGKLLDKFPEWHKWFKDLLDLKASKDSVRRLVPMASTSVAKLVTEYYKLNRGESWRTPNYPTTDFSKSDLNSLEKDPNPPQETIVDACMFVAVHHEFRLQDFIKKLDDTHLDKLIKRMKADANLVKHQTWSIEIAEELWEKRHKWEEIPSVSSKVPKLEKKADEWQGQKNAEPFGKPEQGMWSDPAVKEGDKKGVSLADAIKFFIENGDRFNKQPTEIDLTSKFVKWSDGSRSTFDEFVELYSHHISKKDADFGMLDGPVDQGKHHDGDFPSVSWMPSGEEGKGVDTNYTSAAIVSAAVRSILGAEFQTDLMAPEAPIKKEYGDKEVTKYDPAGEFLIKLVKLVIKEGVPQEEVMALANAFPVATVDEAGDLAAKVWTLATTKYKIPREWLIKKLPEAKASLNKKADSLQRGNAYVMRSVDQIDVEVDPKVEAILKTPNLTDDQKFDAIVERIKEMFWELGDESMVVKDTDWSPGEVDGSDVQGIIDDHNERIEEALDEAAHDAMTTEEEDQSYDRLSKAPWNR